jgi:hypothetical protein
MKTDGPSGHTFVAQPVSQGKRTLTIGNTLLLARWLGRPAV